MNGRVRGGGARRVDKEAVGLESNIDTACNY